MKLHTEDPRLTAFLLGELPADEAEAVEKAVAEDIALRDALRELRTTRKVLTETLPGTPLTLLPSQRENIRRAAAEAAKRDQSKKILKFPARLAIPLAAAAAVGLAFLIFHSLPDSHSQPTTADGGKSTPEKDTTALQRPSVRLVPVAGSRKQGTGTSHMAGIPKIRPHDYIAAADFPALVLPVQSGKSCLDTIRKSVVAKRELPEPATVRLDEMLNAFSIRPAGSVVVAKIPDTGHLTEASNRTVTISTESMACPWKPSANLVFITLRDSSNIDCEIKAVFHADSKAVRRYRLLGYSPVEVGDTSASPAKLPAKSSATLALEVEPATPSGNLGVIEWSLNGQPAPSVTLAHHGDAEPSDDARFASLVCTYAIWLVREPGSSIDTDLLAALARENTTGTLSGDRSDFIHLIDQSLNL